MKVYAAYENGGLVTENITGQELNKISGDSIKLVPSETAAIKSSVSNAEDSKLDMNQITYQKVEDAAEVLKLNENTAQSEEEQLENNKNRLTQEDYESITKEGISLEQYNIERLDRALVRIKSQRMTKDESIQKQAAELDIKREKIEKIAYGTGAKKQIIEKLEQADMPITDANIAKVAGALEMANAAIPMTDEAMNYLIKNQLDSTIGNIYKAQHSGSKLPAITVSDETWKSIEGQVTDIITEAGLKINNETMDVAKWLLENQLPLTKNNLNTVLDLRTISKEFHEEAVMDQVIKAISLGQPGETVNLYSSNVNLVEKNIAAFQLITDETIKNAVKDKSLESIARISAKDLLNIQTQLNENKLEENKVDEYQLEEYKREVYKDIQIQEESLDIATITVRRKLEEIRLKMTMESGQQLTQKGFRLDTDSLSKIVDGLKELENQYYRNLLKEGDISVNEENTNLLKESIESIEQLKSVPAYVLGSTLDSQKFQTIRGLLEAGQNSKMDIDTSYNRKLVLETAKTSYETLMTSPRADMGDSITKAFGNVDDILKSLDLEITKANERAVRILGYNQMEITEENIQNIKAYDSQVNNLFKNLQPAVTVELIKEGINPLHIPIEDLNLQIQEIKDQLGVSKEEKYSKFLWKLEKEQGIAEEEKKSYIGIYRLLNAVDKTDGAALGAVIKAEQEVNLNNLLTAVRTLKSGGIKADINDSFGILDEFTMKEPSITSQIEQGYSSNKQNHKDDTKTSYMNQLIKDIMDDMTPGKLAGIGTLPEMFVMSAENLYESMEQIPENQNLKEQYDAFKISEYQNLATEAQDALKVLKNFQLPNNMIYLQAAKDMLSTDPSFYKQWKTIIEKVENNEQSLWLTEFSGLSEQIIQGFDTPGTTRDIYEDMKNQVDALLDSTYNTDDITSQEILDIKKIQNGIVFMQKLATRDSFIIPIPSGESITQVNVTIIRNAKETGKVKMSIKSENLGQINIDLSVKEDSLKGLILADNRMGLEILKSAGEELANAVKETGIEVKQMNYGLDQKLNRSFPLLDGDTSEYMEVDNGKESVATKTLYNITKTILLQIKNIETRSNNEN